MSEFIAGACAALAVWWALQTVLTALFLGERFTVTGSNVLTNLLLLFAALIGLVVFG